MRFVIVLFSIFGAAFGVYYGVVRTLPKETQEFKLNGVGSIVLSQPTREGGHEYLVVVHPQGWQETAIAVKEGDTLGFDAGGSVYIDLGGLNRSLDLRHKFEDDLADREKRRGKWLAERKTLAAEDLFTVRQLAEIKPAWSWNGPDGSEATAALSFPGRRSKTIIPGARYGELLGAIRETGLAAPDRADAFRVGTHSSGIVARRNGKLYFTVNDVWDDKDKSFPEKFFVDNIGFFYVKVTVAPKAK